ncbi:LytTR family DNA-binding domain-containing protein [uncultured Sunxiuqinia sp.]|uniref:LytR/AlgR family response regulator transcription factor n=1 Tax=uncultured Sunxiuqinia sp. TaxID=1573825 RepID=UPI002AA7DCBD|nr:LytTR family DNA-binding domain-containing protein [uncultured Sunxiuqinia sp.]
MKFRILIFEDEQLTAERLEQLLLRLGYDLDILGVLNSIKQGVAWFKSNPNPDLILMDIHLSDGSCFELFNKVTIDVPVIFTTAYDDYAIKAFKVNSIDYLLKPIDFQDLSEAFNKFRKYQSPDPQAKQQLIQSLYEQISRKGKYKQRFLVKLGEQLKRIESREIAYFIFDDGLVWANSQSGLRLPMDQSLEQLEQLLDPSQFFRINRKMLINLNSVKKIHLYFNSRLKLHLDPDFGKDVIVSRERVNDFKEWMG